jgi:hypothetical protein
LTDELQHLANLIRKKNEVDEAKWDEVMTTGHLKRLKRARDLLAVKGYDTSRTALACYSGAGFGNDLQHAAYDDARVRLIGLGQLYDNET